MAKADGGAAFPRPHSRIQLSNTQYHRVEAQSGMSLRDYFAAAVMAGPVLASLTFPSPEEFARACYELADAMIQAREVGE